MELGAMAWTELDAPIVVVPVGSCEQHGPHLPLDTDSRIARALAERLCEARAGCVVAPTLAVTASGEHAGFAGTLSIGTEVMAQVAIELARSADWASGVVFVNGHGGNADAMRAAARVLEHERRRVLVWWPSVPDGDLHAGDTETSIMLHVAPDQVRVDRIAAGPTPSISDLRASGVRPLSANGVLGDPTDADAERGRTVFESLVGQLLGAVDGWA